MTHAEPCPREPIRGAVRRRTIFVALLAAAALAPAARAERVVERLDNGLTVIVETFAGATSTAILLDLPVGELHDPPGRSGMAHLAEHCLVTCATDRAPATTAEAWFAAHPAGANAQTGYDDMVLAVVVPAADAGDAIRDMAARLTSLRVTAADLDRERPRLAAELANMYGGIAMLTLVNAGRAAVDPMPGGHRKGGRAEQLADVTPEEMAAWLAAQVRPEGATLSIAGAGDPAALGAVVRESFGAWPAGRAAPPPSAAPNPAAADDVMILPMIAPGTAPGTSLVARVRRAPLPGDADYPAYLVYASRLLQHAQRMRSVIPPVHLAPLDDPRIVALLTTTTVPPEDADDDAACAARARATLDALEATLLDRPLAGGEGRTAAANIGPILGLRPLPPSMAAGNPYFVAFVNARTRRLGVDAEAIGTALEALDEATFTAFRARWVARPRRDVMILGTP